MIKVDIKFNVKLYVELKKDTIEALMSAFPAMAFKQSYNPKNYTGWTEFTDTFEFESLSEFMIKFDNTVKEYFEDYERNKFGHDIWLKNYIAIENIKWTIEKISGIVD